MFGLFSRWFYFCGIGAKDICAKLRISCENLSAHVDSIRNRVELLGRVCLLCLWEGTANILY